jgi:hypothetical protein
MTPWRRKTEIEVRNVLCCDRRGGEGWSKKDDNKNPGPRPIYFFYAGIPAERGRVIFI